MRGGSFFLFLKTLIEEEIKGQEYAQCLAREVFEQILNPMIDTLSEKVFNHENSLFYKNAAIVLRSFAEFERLFLCSSPCRIFKNFQPNQSFFVHHMFLQP